MPVARSMWKGAIQFGLVTIPVKLYMATESDYAIRFNMLHETDLSRIQMKIWCPEDEKVISRGETVRGYEYAPASTSSSPTRTSTRCRSRPSASIEIEQFAPRDDTTAPARAFIKQAYYIEPDKIGRKAFYLLRQVLAEKGLTAICKIVIRDREALAALDPFEDTMLLSTLHWPDEIRSTGELDLPDEEFEFKPAEKRMAEQLVEAMTGEFDPAQVPGRVPRGTARGHRGQGRRRRGRGARAGRGEREPRRPDEAARGERQGGRGRAGRPPRRRCRSPRRRRSGRLARASAKPAVHLAATGARTWPRRRGPARPGAARAPDRPGAGRYQRRSCPVRRSHATLIAASTTPIVP